MPSRAELLNLFAAELLCPPLAYIPLPLLLFIPCPSLRAGSKWVSWVMWTAMWFKVTTGVIPTLPPWPSSCQPEQVGSFSYLANSSSSGSSRLYRPA